MKPPWPKICLPLSISSYPLEFLLPLSLSLSAAQDASSKIDPWLLFQGIPRRSAEHDKWSSLSLSHTVVVVVAEREPEKLRCYARQRRSEELIIERYRAERCARVVCLCVVWHGFARDVSSLRLARIGVSQTLGNGILDSADAAYNSCGFLGRTRAREPYYGNESRARWENYGERARNICFSCFSFSFFLWKVKKKKVQGFLPVLLFFTFTFIEFERTFMINLWFESGIIHK